MRKALFCLIFCLLAAACAALAEDAWVADCAAAPGQAPEIRYFLPETGTASLSLTDETGSVLRQILSPRQLIGGKHVLLLEAGAFDGLPAGEYRLVLAWAGGEAAGVLRTGESSAAAPAQTPVPAPTSAPTQTPAPAVITPALRSGHSPAHENCYWCTPMDIADEAAVWAMLTAPMTVVNAGQKEQVLLYSTPDAGSEAIGVITGASQGVHVLETRGDGWTLVETYSSSFHDSKVKNWNAFVTGYIQSARLKTVPVNQEYGIVIDKLTQRLYLFHNGRLETELLCSTGLYNERQPYNETRSGEFMIVSRVGDFKSDNLVCGLGLRFNGGDLLHEVPHTVNADGSKNYKNCEPKLGTRASHGCIRVQRLRNADGVNMRWLWNHIKNGTKLVVWEDYQGRQIPVPADDTPVYYNPDGGSNYHLRETCAGVKEEYLPLSAFPYAALDGEHADLTPCPYCCPPRRKAEIGEINREHSTQSPGEIMELLKK